MGMDDDAVHSGVQAPYNRDDLEYELIVRQEPKQARMCGIGTKADRRPIDPPPVVQLRVTDKRKTGSTDDSELPHPSSYLQNPYYFMYASLASPETDEELHLLKDGKTRCTTGSVVSSLYCLKDPEATGDRATRDAGFFVFPDLSVRTEGTYRLKLTLFEVVGANVHYCKCIFSARFYVYTAKKFPGMEESTNLSCALADQGIKVRIRKDVRARRVEKCSHDASLYMPIQNGSDNENSEGEDDEGRGNARDRDRDATMEDTRASKRARSDTGDHPPSPRAPPPPPAAIDPAQNESGTWSSIDPSLAPPPVAPAPVPAASQGEYNAARAYNTPPASGGAPASATSAPTVAAPASDTGSAPASATSPHPPISYADYSRGPAPYPHGPQTNMYQHHPPAPGGYGWGYGYAPPPSAHFAQQSGPTVAPGNSASGSNGMQGPGQGQPQGGYMPPGMMHHGPPPPPHGYPYYDPSAYPPHGYSNHGHSHHSSQGHPDGPPTPISPPHAHGHAEYPPVRGSSGMTGPGNANPSPTSPQSATSQSASSMMYHHHQHYMPPPQGYYGGVPEPYGQYSGNSHGGAGSGNPQFAYVGSMRQGWGGEGYGGYGAPAPQGGVGGYVRPGPDDGSGRRSPPVPSISGRDRIQLAPLRSASGNSVHAGAGPYSAGHGKKNPLSIGSIISDET